MLKRALRNLSNLSKLSNDHLSYFHSILPPSSILTTDLDSYNTDWLREHKGSSTLVLKPNSKDQIIEILKYCNTQHLGIVPQSGNTSLVGGGVPVGSEIILSMQNLNKVIKLDENQGIVWTEAGVVLETLNNYCSDKGWIIPLDLAAKGSCMIGGNISTNAGGVRYIRYGSLHGNVIGLEVVLANGEVLSDLNALRKDNTGLDLKQLFIGSEGTLGVITKAAILLAPKPSSIQTSFLACNSYENVVKILKIAKSSLGEILSAYEFLDSLVMDVILKHIPNTRNPFSQSHDFYVLVETSGSNSKHDEEKMERFIEEVYKEGLIVDGVQAQDSTQASGFWRIREGGAVATLKEAKHLFKFDFSMRIPEMYKFVERVRERVGDKGRVLGYGHVGDGNLHLTVMSDHKEVHDIIYPYLYEEVRRCNGSISAEHGIGLFKRGLIHYSKEEKNIEYMV